MTPVDPPNNTCERAALLERDQAQIGTNRGATGTDLTLCGLNDTRDVWFRFVPDTSGTYEFSTCADGPPSTRRWPCSRPAPARGRTGVPIACNDDAAPAGACAGGGATLSRVTVRLEVGVETLIRVAGVNGGQGSFMLQARYARPDNDNCATAQVWSQPALSSTTRSAPTATRWSPTTPAACRSTRCSTTSGSATCRRSPGRWSRARATAPSTP